MNLGQLFESILDAVGARQRFHGFYRYEVAGNDAAQATLRRVGDVSGLPDEIPIADKRYGAHGVTCESRDGQQVLVGFEGGDPSIPYVAHYLPGNPKIITVDAVDTIQIGTTGAHGVSPAPGGGDPSPLRVHVGTHDRKPVARRDDPVACGVLQLTPGAGIATIAYTNQAGFTYILGTIAASGLVFSPDPFTAGRADITGNITAGSVLFDSE